jgi:aryl sulfotransferase
MPQADLPRKTRELMNHHMDSTIWNDFPFRNDDIIVATYAKSGTTWIQQIVGQLVFQGDPAVPVHDISPWVDLRVPPAPVKLEMLAAQSHRRILKTHLPLDALTFSPDAKYLYIARDGRDVVFSFHHHHTQGNALWYQILNDTPGRIGPPMPPCDPDQRRYFRNWLDQDGYPLWSFWENIATWWAARHLPNVKLVHFNQLKSDMAGQMRAIAQFLEIDVPPERWSDILKHCSFDYMKANAANVAPLGGGIFEGGAGAFFNKGTNGRWRDVLSAGESDAYEKMAMQRLGADCAHWLATGEGA